MATQTGSYDFKAAKAAHDEAAKVAGNYIVSTAANDVWIHSEDHGPNANGEATSNTYGWRIGSVFELVRAGLSYVKMWVENSVAKVRVGLDTAGHSIFSPDGMEVFSDASTSVAAFGENGARIGKMDTAHALIDTNSFSIASVVNVPVIQMGVGDPTLLTMDFTGDGTSTWFYLGDGNTITLPGIGTNTYIVTADGVDVTEYVALDCIYHSGSTNSTKYRGVSFAPNNAPADGAEIHVDIAAQSSPYLAAGSSPSSSTVGAGSIAWGTRATARGENSIAVGLMAGAVGSCSTAFGSGKAFGDYAFGANTAYVTGFNSAGFGSSTVYGSHGLAAGYATEIDADYQTVFGKYNKKDTNGDYALIVGNGTQPTLRSNAATIGWDGNYMAQAMAGIIQMFAGSTPPTGWLVCDGSAVSRTTYATLFAAIGTTWGTGDGSTTFNLPDLRGRAPVGAGAGSGLTSRTLGGKAGVESVTLTAAQSGVPAHGHGHTIKATTPKFTHSITQPEFAMGMVKTAASGTAKWHSSSWADKTGSYTANRNTNVGVGDHAATACTMSGSVSNNTAANASSAHTNMQPFAVVNFIICTGKTS